jgi:chromosome segregation ATPase
MKRYLKNLLAALLGNNPYQAERDELAAKLEQAGDNVRGLNELYYTVLEKWAANKRQLASLQQLVENLRERIADKDAAIAQYIIEVDALRKNADC